MNDKDGEAGMDVSRRRLLAAAGLGAGAALAGAVGEPADAARLAPNALEAPPVSGPHLQFGADAASEVVISWH